MGDCALGPTRTDESMILPRACLAQIFHLEQNSMCALEIELGESRTEYSLLKIPKGGNKIISCGLRGLFP